MSEACPLEAIHPDDRPQAKETVERLLDGQPAEIEHRVNERENYQRWVSVRGQPITDDGGEVVRIVGITTEITERKEREQQLRLFRRAVESSGHSIYFTNQNGLIENVNEAFTETTGYTAEEAIGRTPQILQSGEHDQEFYEELWTTILDGDVWRNEVINERKDGERYVIDQTIAPVTDEAGEIAHFVAVNVDITEQKRTEQRLEAFIDSASDILSIVDDKGVVQEVSPAAKDIIGYAPEEIVGESVFEYIHPEDRQHVEEKFSDLVASTGDDTIRVQYRFDHADGSWHWLESVGNNCMDTTLEGCVITTLDISERKERIQELEQASARLEALFERSPDMINVHDSDGTILDVNQRFCDVLNATEDELIGKEVWEIDEAHDSDEFHRKIQQIDVGERLRTETKYQCQDGATIPIEVHVVRTTMGDDERFIVISRDITEQKTYEDQLRKERQFVQSIFDALPDPLYAFDTEGRLIRWNDQFEEITGHCSDEIEGKHFTEFVPEKEIETITQSFQTLLEEGQSVTVESLVETNDGDPIPFELTGGPLADSTDGLQGITGVGRDITERKKHEQQLTTLNETAQDVMSVDTRQQVAEIGIHAARDVLGLDANAVHLYDDDQNGLVPTAQTDEGNALVGDPPILKEGDSITWRVYTSGETLAHDNVQNDPDVHNPETSVQSELYLPLGEHGVFIVASEESEAFDEQDRILGEILAGTLTAAFDQVEHAEQLRAREQELARQNERLEEFVNVVSHDLRNPLNVAEARVELAQDECDSEHLEPEALEASVGSSTETTQDEVQENISSSESTADSNAQSEDETDATVENERTDDILYTSDFTTGPLSTDDFTGETLDVEHLAVGPLEIGYFVGDAFDELRVDAPTTVERHTAEIESPESSASESDLASKFQKGRVLSTYVYVLEELGEEAVLDMLYEEIYLEDKRFCTAYAERLIEQDDEERALEVVEHGIDTFRSTTDLRWLAVDLYRDREADKYKTLLKQLFLDHSEWDAYDELKEACTDREWASIYGKFERKLDQRDRQRLISMYVHEMDLEKAFFELKEAENLSWIRRYQDPVATVDPIEYFEMYREQLIPFAAGETGRRHYREITDHLESMQELVSDARLEEFVEFLKDKHSNRPAFLDELEKAGF